MSRIALGDIAKRFLFLAEPRVLMNFLNIFSINEAGWSLCSRWMLLLSMTALGCSFVSREFADDTLSLLAETWAHFCIPPFHEGYIL
jgi:hypothetical protein